MAKVSLRVYNQEIEAMIDRGQLDEAVAHCKHILKTFPKHLETYRLLGKAYLEYKRYPDAVNIFARVLVAAPDDFVANVGMSIIRDEEDKLDEAIWHMERAFETQPSNAAIQSELQRLYGRREGVQPPRIRMTRGALAHMYVQGELYPQAISEIKSVLKEDPARMDMQVLLARAYFKSGLKNDAADVASAVLRSNPYCLDANKVLVEILGVEHPESVQAYRQRVVELDPYAAQVASSVFLSDEVPNMAVTLERLDWNGQPVGMQPDWEARQAISLESSQHREEQPDWLADSLGEAQGSSQPTPFDQTPAVPVSPFDAAPPSAKPAGPADEIPDFLRAAGWGESTGAFDESKPIFADEEPASGAQPIEQGELPDWVQAMAPPQPAETPAEEEELPDWINKIGTGALPVSPESSSEADWMSQLNQPASPSQPADNQPDWLKEFGTSEQAAPAASEDQPDWLKSFASEEATASAAPAGELDWLSQLAESETQTPQAAGSESDFLQELGGRTEATPPGELDWISQLGESEAQTPQAASSETDFLKELGGQAEAAPAASSTDEFDFLNELTAEAGQLAPSSPPESPEAEPLGMSSNEQDDAFAWLENLAAKQGATEGLLTKPEERLQEEPDWIKQVKGAETVPPPAEQPPVEQPPVQEPAIAQPAGNLEQLGKSEQEQDDSFAWLESLAAKQGTTEGLLTKPEERLEQEPEWVQQAKSLGEQPTEEIAEPVSPEEELPVPEATASLEDLGKSEQERDDSFAWLESLAAKQGATEGLLTKPEDRLEEAPEWVKQAKDVEAEQPPVPTSAPEQPSAVEDTAAWLRSLDEEEVAPASEALSTEDTSIWLKSLEEKDATPASEALSMDETAMWLQGLDEKEATPTPETLSTDDTALWLKNLDEPEKVPSQSAEALPADDLPAWMQNIDEEQPPPMDLTAEVSQEVAAESDWVSAAEEEQPVPQAEQKIETGSLPSWLRGLDKEETPEAVSAAEEGLPAWLRDETGEVVAEPTKIEPTRSTDWQPAEIKEPEVAASAPEPEPPAPEPVAPPPAPPPQEAPVEPAVVELPPQPASPLKPPKEPPPRRAPEMSPSLDPILTQARNEFSRSDIPAALDNYGRLIKKGRFLEEVIYDLREALYRYPVEVSIWQALGDAYMRSNRLQDALDSYTKAEELLR